MGSLMPQWSLDRTTNGLIGIARGVLEAATTDNVQALALLACESFGASLAMSPESCHKAYLLCNRSHESAMLLFLKAQVGYRKGDCGWQLAQSDAGLRFLGLAACLSSIGSWNAAVILHKLIYTTASDKKLVPTSQHLKQLMQVVEDRLARSGFSESALGWAAIFNKEMEASDDMKNLDLVGQKNATMAPSTEAVVGLTQAMSRLARVGEDIQRIEITTTADHAAWFVAFIKWCLGAPPLIISYNNQTLGSQNDSQVTLRLIKSTRKSQDVRVDLHEYTGNIKNLVNTAPSLAEFRGLVGIEAYGQAMLRRHFGLPSDPRYRACIQALPYACLMVRNDLTIIRESSAPSEIPLDVDQWVGSNTIMTKGQVFASVDKISLVMHNYLGGSHNEQPPHLVKLSNGTIIEDLSLVSLVKSRMTKDCPCRSCQNTSRFSMACQFESFMLDVSRCVADILALSLLNPIDPNGVQVYFGFIAPVRFVKAIRSILLGEKGVCSCSVDDILLYVVGLLGHDESKISTWIMSSRYDQTIYPRLFSTQIVQTEGILSLECIPGTLMWGDERYATVQVDPVYQHWDFEDEDSDTEYATLEGKPYQKIQLEDGIVLSPKDSYSGYKLQWQLKFKEREVHVVAMLPQFSTFPGRNPRKALDSVVESLFVDCLHGRMASFTPSNGSIYITSALDPRPPPQTPHAVGVVECDQNEPMRFFTLANGRPGIVRMDACLECCVKSAEVVQFQFVAC